MSTLCTRLRNVEEAGVYQLNCSVDELSAAAGQAGFVMFEADMSKVHQKGEFLAAIAQAIHAPAWFGANWDALADALGDLSWCPSSGYVLLLCNSENALGLNDDRNIASEILAGTATFWKSQGKPFWIFSC